jgi:dTDP-4-amino-4,6-dideoxygalactose transaminase
MKVPFNRPTVAPRQAEYVQEAFSNGHLSGDGPFTKRATQILSDMHLGSKVLLTTSCTSALELAALLLELEPGDEVIVPSFTFVSSANAFVIMGATVVFAEIERETLSVSLRTIEPLVTQRTKAIVTVNYGGAPTVTPDLVEFAKKRDLIIIEDNAHGLFGSYDGKPLGTQSALSTLSFHETKNITCGEGGALVINDPRFAERAEIIREKGTNRSQFFRGMVDKYTWVDKGSSYLMSDINAAVLLAQLEHSDLIQLRRRDAFVLYMAGLREWSDSVGAALPHHLVGSGLPYHLFPILMPGLDQRSRLLEAARQCKIGLTFHYVPLHSSPAGKQFGSYLNELPTTEQVADTLIRLPLFSDMSTQDAIHVIEFLNESV